MAATAPQARTIDVDEEIYDLLERTASAQGTDVNGALHYLLDIAPPQNAPDVADEEEDSSA